MTRKILRLFVLFTGIVLSSYSQSNPDKEYGKAADTSVVNSLIQQSKENASSDPNKAIALATQAKSLAEKINYLKGQANSHKYIGLGYYYQGKYVESLNEWHQSQKLFEELKDDIGVANLLNNMAAIYVEQGDEEKALEYSLHSLKLSEKAGDKLRIISALNTIGTIYNNKEQTQDKALE